MSVHLIKLCVGAASADDLGRWQRDHRTRYSKTLKRRCARHATRQQPKRSDDLLDGGSLYWVIKGVIQVRQKLLGFETGRKQDGTPCCLFLLDNTLVPVRPSPRRAFQGWRYLEADDAPRDIGICEQSQFIDMPAKMQQELAALCLI